MEIKEEQKEGEKKTIKSTEIEEKETLNWMQKMQLKATMKKLEKLLKKEQDITKQRDEEFRYKQIVALMEIFNDTGITYYEEECECGKPECNIQNTENTHGHEKREIQINKEILKRKTSQELSAILEELLKELRVKI